MKSKLAGGSGNKPLEINNIAKECAGLLSYIQTAKPNLNHHNILILQYIQDTREEGHAVKIQDEEELTQRAVNEAARETTVDDDEPLTGEMLPATLKPTGPDLKIYIATDELKGRYVYQIIDGTTGMSHRCVAFLKGADETALALLAVHNAFKSILKVNATGLILERYGFARRKDVVASRQHLKVELFVTDPAMVELGRIVTGLTEQQALNRLPLTANDRELWLPVRAQTRRFDTTWNHVNPTDSILLGLASWADVVLARVAEHGPVNPLQPGFDMPVEEAA